MPRERARHTIFLSHAQTDVDAAKALKCWLESVFGSDVRVFASSDWQSIEMGADWYDTIDRALNECALGVLLLTQTSIKRPWVNYELGALRATKKKTIPLCVSPVTKAALPSPFTQSQACDYDSREDRLGLLRSIASTFGFPTAWIPENLADNAPTLSVGTASQLAPFAAGHGLPLEQLFNADDRWTTVVYTCRAVFTGEECIADGPIKKSLWAHVPVDEVQTVCVAINHLMPPELRAHEDDILKTVTCSKCAEDSVHQAAAGRTGTGHIPPIIGRDLIVVGENNFSNLLLQMMRPYLPWQARVDRVARNMQEARPDVYVRLVPRFNARVTAGQKREVHKGGAMIAIFPNPFNVRKRVLILFGCHREGQFTLENWLRGDEIGDIVAGIGRKAKKGALAVQVVVDRTLSSADGMTQPVAVEAIRNADDDQRFWLTPLNRFGIGETVLVNRGCAEPHAIYDLSLVVPLPPEEQAQLAQLVRARVGIHDLYWEHEQCEIGFHITLYEFLTHDHPDPQLLTYLQTLPPKLCDVLGPAEERVRPSKITVRVRGIEFLQAAMVCYVDFLDEAGRYTTWLDSVRRRCEEAVTRLRATVGSHLTLFNAMRVPFPVHITLCRFDHEIPEAGRSELRRIANESRTLELLRFPITTASLAVATKTPYREAKIAAEWRLS